jgi:hypothetical protein
MTGLYEQNITLQNSYNRERLQRLATINSSRKAMKHGGSLSLSFLDH